MAVPLSHLLVDGVCSACSERAGVESSLVQGPEQVCIERAMVLDTRPFWLLALQRLQVGAREASAEHSWVARYLQQTKLPLFAPVRLILSVPRCR